MNRILGGALALGAALALTTQVNAADLGGNCCADLEERIAELEATTARKGNRKVSLEVYGQVNAAFLYVDETYIADDEAVGSTERGIIDNPTSESRFGFVGKAKIREGWSAGYRMEIGVGGRGYADDLSVRHSSLFIETPMGKLSLGRQSMATDDFDAITTASGTSHIVRPLQNLGESVSGYGYGIDGSRAQIVRYDTPAFAGFSLAASSDAQEDGMWDAALRYAGEFGGFRVAGGLGYRNEAGDDVDTIVAALSGMHVESGIFVTGNYGQVRLSFVSPIPDQELVGWHLTAGVERKLSDLGKTTLFGEYASADGDDGIAGSKDPSVELYGLGINQAIDAAVMDIYVSYRHMEFTDGDALVWDGPAEVDQFLVGSRIRF